MDDHGLAEGSIVTDETYAISTGWLKRCRGVLRSSLTTRT